MHINGSSENQAPIGPGSPRTTVFISVQGQRLWGWKGPEEHLVHQPPSSYRLENCLRRAVTCLRPHTEQYPAVIIIWSQPIPPGSGPGGRTPGANPPPRSAPGRSPAERGMEEFPHGSVQSTHSVVSNSFRPDGPQHTRLPCPSPTPRVYSNSLPLSR